MDNINKRKTSLTRKIASNLFVLAFFMVVATSLVVCNTYYTTKIDETAADAFDFARTAAGYIDGDRISGYLETGEKDEYYEQVQRFLDIATYETDLKYYYVFVPLDNEIVYIWDARNDHDVADLGETEKYFSKEDEKAIQDAFVKGPKENIVMSKDKEYGFLATAYSPIYDSTGEPVAIVGVDMYMEEFLDNIRKIIAVIIISVLGVTLAAVALIYLVMDKKLIQPLNKLTTSANKMVSNIERDEAIKIDVHTGDEFEELADAFNKMDLDLREYISELKTVTAEKERISAELSVATRIQAGFLPNKFPPFPERKDFELYASMTPAKEVGGDFYDFFMVDDDHIALVMADVSGKGVPAALFMVVCLIFIKLQIKGGLSPGEALTTANEKILEGNNSGMFVTVWLAIIDLKTGKGIAANGGHEHPALRRKDGKFELVKYKHSPAVSTIKGLKFREHEFNMNPGDTLFVYTDGVTEAANSDFELFGEKRLVEALNTDKESDPEHLIETVRDSIGEFVGDAPQFDDITMLGFRYLGEQE